MKAGLQRRADKVVERSGGRTLRGSRFLGRQDPARGSGWARCRPPRHRGFTPLKHPWPPAGRLRPPLPCVAPRPCPRTQPLPRARHCSAAWDVPVSLALPDCLNPVLMRPRPGSVSRALRFPLSSVFRALPCHLHTGHPFQNRTLREKRCPPRRSHRRCRGFLLAPWGHSLWGRGEGEPATML